MISFVSKLEQDIWLKIKTEEHFSGSKLIVFWINAILNDKENALLVQFFNVLKMDSNLLHNQNDVFNKFKELVKEEFDRVRDKGQERPLVFFIFENIDYYV